MLIKSGKFGRRQILRGVLGGAAVTVGLPLLDCFLSEDGKALAATAQPIPVRFGTWFWGLGMNNAVFIPTKTGADFDLPEEIQALASVRQHINLLTNYRVLTDGRPNLCHYSGWVALRCGSVPNDRSDLPAKSIDVLVADAIGDGTRFRALDCAATGNPRDSYSFSSADSINVPEVSAIDFYTKVFGPDFRNPNSPTFTPDPKVMLRESVLSGVSDERAAFERDLGAADKARLDEYYTSLRQLEQRLQLQLQKPPPAPSCKIPAKPADQPIGIDVDLVQARHRAMTDLMVMAVACNQTRVFNMTYSNSGSLVTRQGYERNHHITTHEEPVDPKLSYQPDNSWFVRRSMAEWAYFVEALAKVPEGDGTLLDNVLVYAHSDQEFAKIHSLNGIPMFTAGRAGGRLKTGLHLDGKGEAGTRLGYTVQKIMGLPISQWGARSMTASSEIGELVA